MRVSSKHVLEKLGYEYIHKVIKGSEPDYVEYTFSDIVPELKNHPIGDKKLYKHQFEGFKALLKGYNLILISGTGSGKTETWILYLLTRLSKGEKIRGLALYPTLALANDQIRRIEDYLSRINQNALQLDSVKRSEYEKSIGRSGLRQLIINTPLVISNPAFVLHDLKKYLLGKSKALLLPFYEKLDLLVIDEIDFYGPRSLALLLAMIKLLARFSEIKPQVVILTATLSNPEDLGEFLKEVTSRDFHIVKGKPFSIENHVYVVLGKNLRSIWEKYRIEYSKVANSIRDRVVKLELEKASSDYDYFVKNIHRIISIASSIGLEIATPSIDYSEILKEYIRDDYVTLVFTRSISQAEELVRSIKFKLGENLPIATHHHLVPKHLREEIEEGARRGRVKVIVSPRTLSQGIDIGTVVRIIHIGLPDSVREFIQREGRKGRRKELGFSETVIIPGSRWDRELLSRGYSAFEKWLSMSIEKTIINPRNYYIYLFTGLAKLLSPWYRESLDNIEESVLRSIGVIKSHSIDYEYAKRIYEKLNFYEYAPPYGIKRYLIKENQIIPLEPIGHCDLVEKFQPGNIDYSEEAIVVSIDTTKSSRIVKAVYEKPIREVDFYRENGFAEAYEEYRYYKLEWNEKPNIIRDILTGRLTSEELCVVHTPWNGFGRYRKVPNRCIWKLRSEKPRVKSLGSRVLVYYDRRQIYVPAPTGGEYRDFTYGYIYSVDPREPADLLRLALASLMIILRRVFGIAFETVMYDVIKLGEYKYFSLHEPEAAGLIDSLDWLEVRRAAEKYVFDDLDEILLSELDEIAYSTLISYDFNWDIVKQYVLRIIDYIIARDKMKLLLSGREMLIPKPSPALKLLSIAPLVEVIGENTENPQILVAISVFEGHETRTGIALYPPVPFIKPPREILELESYVVSKVLYEDFRLVISGRETILRQLKTANLRQLVMLIESGERVEELTSTSKELGLEPLSYEELVQRVFSGIERVEPARVKEIISEIEKKRRISKRAEDIIRKYVELQSKTLYLAKLVLNVLSDSARS
ncbi:MAG: DEAD/DEAH box helicase [Thermoprotei archaeon]